MNMNTEEIQQAFEKHTAEEMARYDSLHEKLDKLLSNHIPHLDTKLAVLDDRMKLCLWVLGVVGSLVIANLFVK